MLTSSIAGTTDENTGKLKYNLALSQTNLDDNFTFCRLVLFNNSIDSCLWGSDGLIFQNMALNYSIPLFFSSIFRVLPRNNTQEPVVWSSVENSTVGSTASKTATSTVTVTCPPSGISAPIIELDIWPIMTDNLTFPGIVPY
jgi:hypothetical protein